MSLDTNWLCAGAVKKDMNQRKNPETESFCISAYVAGGGGKKLRGKQKPAKALGENLIKKLT